VLRVGGWKSRLQAAGKQKAGKFVLAADHPSLDPQLPDLPRNSCAGHLFSPVDLARYRAVKVGSLTSRLHRIGKWLVPVSTWWEKGRAVFFLYHLTAEENNDHYRKAL
jgi:hypothetical protein